jgi:hypothetical protein
LNAVELTVLEHRDSRTARWLRERRLRIALAIAVVEGLLVVAGAIPMWIALLVAAAVLASFLLVGRRLPAGSAHQVVSTAALSQALVALLPVLVFVVGTLAVIAVAILAVVALFVVLGKRR